MYRRGEDHCLSSERMRRATATGIIEQQEKSVDTLGSTMEHLFSLPPPMTLALFNFQLNQERKRLSVDGATPQRTDYWCC